MMLAVCHTCKFQHRCRPGSEQAITFAGNHSDHHVEWRPFTDGRLAKLWRLLDVDLFREIRPGIFEVDRLGYAGYKDNANVNVAYGSTVALTFTSLNSLANSATAGAQSTAVDNTANRYDDYIIQAQLGAPAAGTAANSKAVFLYAHALVDSTGTAYTSTGAATPGATDAALTFLDVTANPTPPMLGRVDLVGVNPPASNGGPFSVAGALGLQGFGPPKFLVSAINQCFLTLNASNTVNHLGVYFTVA